MINRNLTLLKTRLF